MLSPPSAACGKAARLSRQAVVRYRCLRKNNTPPETKTRGEISVHNTNTRAGEQFLPRCCKAKARRKGVFISQTLVSHTVAQSLSSASSHRHFNPGGMWRSYAYVSAQVQTHAFAVGFLTHEIMRIAWLPLSHWHASATRITQWNRNPRPQLEPQIISLETCTINYTLLETPVYYMSRLGVGGSYSIGEGQAEFTGVWDEVEMRLKWGWNEAGEAPLYGWSRTLSR